MGSPPTPSLRRRSPLSALDPIALRELCELHPWDLGRLSAASGFDRSVLSHVFAGRRSLPQNAAHNFLSLIGLLPSGEPDRSHLFVLQARSGNASLLRSWLVRLLPNGSDVVQLHRSTEYGRVSGDPPQGWALFDGETAVLVHGTVGAQLPVSGALWPAIGDVEHADLLLNADNFPARAHIVKTVSDVPTLERHILADPGWEAVKLAAAKKGMAPSDVLDLITAVEPSPHNETTLFPVARWKRARRRES